ncbi:formylglycine-generating enzyme family protein [Muriicola soli]|uniref:formylglycine-generating enzyme family protein n=1 Tax=Muriicola soli TaxID=2507538 RepID=UPI0013EAE350|nr:SUMF1/EgtB/PvdO family nonheme iron enzyme [Muriicola soli]
MKLFISGILLLSFVPMPSLNAQVPTEPIMVKIKGGTYIMGQNDGEGDERPEHLVEIEDFYIAKFEITVSEYREFCLATDRTMPKQPEWGWIDDHPIINTSWNDACDYIQWLNKRTGEDYRLPTEAEFEYVIRNGGEKGVYPWGKALPSNENLADESFRAKTSRSGIWKNYYDGYAFTAPVGSFKPNKLGVCDINGNIWEWCSDWYGEYSDQKSKNPIGATTGKHKVGRGASYGTDPWHSRSASRAYVEPDFKRPGFRLAKDNE